MQAFLLLIALAVCSTQCYTIRDLPVYDVRNYGAQGNGINDDLNAVVSAVNAVKGVAGNAVLYFSAGTYRIGRGIQSQVAGVIEFIGVPQVNIEFAVGATLLMDNLNAQGMGDQLSAIYISGPTNSVQITYPTIVWKTKPTARSQGCGIAMKGYPLVESGKPYITNVVVDHPTIQWAPQAGVIYMGIADPLTISPNIIETMADGVHHNACLRPQITGGVTGKNLGDDVCPFVTYYTPVRGQGIYGGDGPYEPYGLPSLEEWSNSGGYVDAVYAQGGRANAVRIDGGFNITIGTIQAYDMDFAFTTDSAIKTAGYTDWTVQVSRNINIWKISADSCYVPVIGICQFVNKSADGPSFYAADIHIGSVYATNSESWPVQISAMEGITIDQVVVDGTVLIQNDAANIAIGALSAAALTVDNARNIAIDEITYATSVQMNQVTGITGDTWSVYNSPDTAFSFTSCRSATIAALRADKPNRSNAQIARGVLFAPAQDFAIGFIFVRTDTQALSASIEFGGGSNQQITSAISVGFAEYMRSNGPNSSAVVLQGGPYAPVNVHYNMTYSCDDGKTWNHQSL